MGFLDIPGSQAVLCKAPGPCKSHRDMDYILPAADTHILSCNFIVKTHSALREPLSDEQCSVDGVPLPPYDNDNKRKKGNAPNECADLFPKLKDIGEELRKQLLTMEEEGDLTRGDHSLHVTMVSLYKEGQPIDPYWNFTNDPQRPFSFNHFNPKSKKWAVTHNNTPGIDKWQKNTELAQHLATFSIGDSGRCIKKLLLHWEKMPRSTSRAPDIGNVNSPTQLSSTKVLPSKEGSSVTAVVIPIAILITIVTIPSVIICIYKNAKRKSHPQGGAPGCSSSSVDRSPVFITSCVGCLLNIAYDFFSKPSKHISDDIPETCTGDF
ncbi:Retinoic acid early-inducible protein 1-epsilon [Lemmus lemmus]